MNSSGCGRTTCEAKRCGNIERRKVLAKNTAKGAERARTGVRRRACYRSKSFRYRLARMTSHGLTAPRVCGILATRACCVASSICSPLVAASDKRPPANQPPRACQQQSSPAPSSSCARLNGRLTLDTLGTLRPGRCL
jgi:hypothetical protein